MGPVCGRCCGTGNVALERLVHQSPSSRASHNMYECHGFVFLGDVPERIYGQSAPKSCLVGEVTGARLRNDMPFNQAKRDKSVLEREDSSVRLQFVSRVNFGWRGGQWPHGVHFMLLLRDI